MTELWLPAEHLKLAKMTEVAAGNLVILPERKNTATTLSVGVRVDARDRRMVLALTPFYDGRIPTGDAFEISQPNFIAVTLKAKLAVEVDIAAPGLRAGYVDHLPGSAVATDQGIGLVAYFDRYSQNFISGAFPIDVTTWVAMEGGETLLVFGSWKLRIEIQGLEPIYWKLEQAKLP